MDKACVVAYFSINYCTQPGQDVYVLGNCPELGNWKLDEGLKLSWNDVILFIHSHFDGIHLFF